MSEGEGSGSTFLIDIPLFQADQHHDSSSADEDQEFDVKHQTKVPSSSSLSLNTPTNAASRHLSECRLLIVDDAPSNRKMVKRILQSKFASVEEAENGQEAVRKYEESVHAQKPYDIIMMDNIMPVMDGLDATKSIRLFYTHLMNTHSKDQTIFIPPPPIIIGVTGNGIEEDIKLFLQAGANKILVKPLNVHVLWEYLQQENFKVFN
jgi:CheY-like chemotaxis protein